MTLAIHSFDLFVGWKNFGSQEIHGSMGQGKGGTMLRGLSQQRVLIRPAPGNPEQWLSLSCPTTQGFQKCVFVFLTEAFKNSVGFSKEGNEDQC